MTATPSINQFKFDIVPDGVEAESDTAAPGQISLGKLRVTTGGGTIFISISNKFDLQPLFAFAIKVTEPLFTQFVVSSTLVQGEPQDTVPELPNGG